MKKTLFLIIIALLVVGTLFAATSTKFNKYANIFKSGEYTVKGSMYTLTSSGTKTGSPAPVTIAMHAGQYYMDVAADGENVKMILKDGKLYVIADSEKMVMVLPGDDEEADSMLKIPATFDYSKSGNGRIDGKSLYYETLNDSNTTEQTYWYNGSDLYAIQMKDGESDSAIFIDSITQSVDSSLFNIPSNYEVMDLSEMASWFSGLDTSSSYDASSSSDSDWMAALEGIDWNTMFSDSDWSSNSDGWDSWDYDDEPHYYAFGILMGLSNAQASAFEDMMYSFSTIEWDELNNYYDSDSNKYDLKGTSLTDAAYIGSYDLDYIKKLINKFK